MKFVTIAGPDSGEFSGRPVMLNSDVRAWVAAGKPPLKTKQLGALCRTLAYNTGRDPEEAVQLAKASRKAITLSQLAARPASPSRVPSNPTSSRPTKSGRTAGNGPKGKKARKAAKRAKRVAGSLAAGEPISVSDVPFLMAGADPDLVALWREQLVSGRVVTLSQPPPSTSSAPLGMDQDRFGLHLQAQKLAADEGLDYADAAVKILDRQAGAIFS